ncbi:MAG: low temperature requirement protein A [Sphingomonas sp.]|nr:low temperature requirement protein A [Sphingomonas sp.]
MSGLLRTRTGHEARVGTVELFFDLIFVFAITQLSHGLLAHPSLLGAVETLILFLGIWWVWIYTSWVTNWLDPERWQVRMMLFGLMACGLVLSMTIPQAWGARGLYFGVAFAVMQVGRSLFTMLALRGHDAVRYRNFQRITLWLVASALLWIGGGLSDGPMRMALWVGALLIEYAGPFALFYVPGLGGSTTADWNVAGEHLAERCGLFIIIALGESILITGSTAATLPWTAPVLAAFASAFLGTVAMWWIYFNIGAERASHLIAHHDDPGRIARIAYTYGHIPVVAGIIVSAASDEMLVAHPTGHIAPAAYAMTLGGAALFIAGNMIFKGLTWTHRPLSHWIGLGLLALLAVLPFHDGYALGLATAGVLLFVAVWETWSLRGSLSAPPA